MANKASFDHTPTGYVALRKKLRVAKRIGAHLELPPRTTQRLLNNGTIPGFQIGGIWFAYPETLDAWIFELNDRALRRAFGAGIDD